MDEQLRHLWRAALTGDFQDRQRFEAGFLRAYETVMFADQLAILEALGTHPLVIPHELPGYEIRPKEYGVSYGVEGRWNRGAYYDNQPGSVDRYRTHFSWTDGGWAISSLPVHISSQLSQLEVVDIVLYYSLRTGENRYRLLPKWIHQHTDQVLQIIVHPTINQVFAHKVEGFPD